MISQREIKRDNLSKEDVINIIQIATGLDAIGAEFLYAIEMGELDGDVIAVDSKGQPVKGE